jgi:hypothetical protein
VILHLSISRDFGGLSRDRRPSQSTVEDLVEMKAVMSLDRMKPSSGMIVSDRAMDSTV